MIEKKRIQKAFTLSRKLKGISPNIGQIENIKMRLNLIFTEEEIQKMDEKQFTHQIERVWPIAKYIDED